jgi:hypothetical protein
MVSSCANTLEDGSDLHDSCGMLNLVKSHDESCKGDDGRSDVARSLLCPLLSSQGSGILMGCLEREVILCLEEKS